MTRSTSIPLVGATVSTGGLPFLRVETDDPAEWAAGHREEIRAFVAEHGSLLVRGLGLRDGTQAAAVFRQLGSLMTEREAFAPRSRLSDGVYSASKWPPKQPMCPHHELSYTLRPPRFMLFACLAAPASMGATPLADAAQVLDALPPGLVERFERHGWLLVRAYNGEIGASVEDAFGTDDRTAVEGYCRANGIELEWQPDGTLHTRQRRAAVVRHPVTGRRCWFNQVAFLNEWSLAPEVRDYLVDMYGREGLPFNTQMGNGDPIDPDLVRTINEVYEAKSFHEPWNPGDLLVVDNVATAHGRQAFEGHREVVVGLADPGLVSEGA